MVVEKSFESLQKGVQMRDRVRSSRLAASLVWMASPLNQASLES